MSNNIKIPDHSLLDLLNNELVPEAEGSDHSYNAAVRNCISAIKRMLKTPSGIMSFAIDVGRPLVRQSFPGPEAHKLTANEYAYEIGKCTIGCELGLVETKEIKSIDSHLPKIRFDAPFDKKYAIQWYATRFDTERGAIEYHAFGPKESFVVFEGVNAKADCNIFMKAVGGDPV